MSKTDIAALADAPMDAPAGDRLARRNALILAFAQALAGANNTVIVATTGIIAVVLVSFALLCAGAFFAGLYAAAHQSYRFAAADTASEAFRPKAISWVLAGGIFAGIVGPQVVILTKDQIPAVLFAAT